MINETLKQELIHGIKKVEKPYKIILFGSYAYGEPDENSDIDLVVVVDNILVFCTRICYCKQRNNVGKNHRRAIKSHNN